MGNQNEYMTLDGGTFLSGFGGETYSFTSGEATTSFLPITTYALWFMLTAIGLAALGMMLYGVFEASGADASSSKIASGHKKITNAFKYTVLSFSLVMIMLWVNPDMVTGDVDLSGFRLNGSKTTTTANTPGRTSTVSQTASSASCTNPDTLKKSLASGSGVCAGATCTVLADCNLTPYLPIIKQEAARQDLDYRFVAAIMCRESRGKKDAVSPPDKVGTINCGLMQINKRGSCTAEDLDPQTNIARGAALLKEKHGAISQIYPNIKKESLVAAAYNCCGGGDNPNASSNDCTVSSGFPYSIPKWACPINPGTPPSNMCDVKSYACSIAACIESLPAN